MNESRIYDQLLSGPEEHICPEPELDILYLNKEQSFKAIQDDSDPEMIESLFLLFCIEGRMQVRSYFKDNYYEQTVQQGWYALQYCPKGSELEYLEGNGAERILLHIVPHRLMDLIADQGSTQEIKGILENLSSNPQIRPISPKMGNLLNRITHPQTGKDCERLYYLSRVLELLCLLTSAPGESEFPAIRTLDRQIIQESMNTLEYNLNNPPSVEVLAEQAGVSLSKFKQLFPKVCGMTSHAYVRKLRMEKAFELLQQGKMNVTDVAIEVGYESISHFSKAFCNYFGLRPSKVNRATLCREKTPDSE